MGKKLIICCDGTWNQPNQKHPTNVTKTARALAPADAEGGPQIVFYDPGVGSSGRAVARWVDGMLGSGLSQNVQDAYRFLSDNHQDGDDIFLFGFSRGAYTVRSLAGLMGLVGLLHKGDMHHFPGAYEVYRMPSGTDAEKQERSRGLAEFRRKLLAKEGGGEHPDRTRFPLIKMIGVWDTVGALGIPAGTIPLVGGLWPNFHDTELNGFVENAYQALAIDEHRRIYEAAVWKKRTKDEPPPDGRPYVPIARQHVEQRWFPGAHSNVGGGYEDAGLSDMAWGWMLEKAKQHGLAFDEEYLALRLRPEPAGAAVDSWADAIAWRLWRRFRRPLCVDETERLHGCVGARYDAARNEGKDPFTPYPYRPDNLKDLLGRDAARSAWRDWI